jgi:hypothetical protein
MSSVHADLLTVLGSVQILTSTSYQLQGQDVREFSAVKPLERANLRPLVSPPIVQALASDLYLQLYMRPSSAARTRYDPLAERDFVAQLSAANGGKGSWEPGWTIKEIDDDGGIAVANDRLVLWVARDDLRCATNTFCVGTSCRLRMSKELHNLNPGYYMAIGDGGIEDIENSIDDEDIRLVRLYWHLAPSGAIPFIRAISHTLNMAHIPFHAKVLKDPATYQRADAAVLYLKQCFYKHTRSALRTVYDLMEPHLRATVPLFTKQLAAGLGLAEDPSNGLSFGQHRCQVIAQALWQSSNQSNCSEEARATTLAAAFQDAGVNPVYPYLNLSSTDHYTF